MSETARLLVAVAACLVSARAAGQEVVFAAVGGAFDAVTDVQHAGGDSALYVSEQAGRIRVLLAGVERPVPLLDIADRTVQVGELGLLGFAFDPLYPAFPHVFVHYVRNHPGGGAGYQTVVARYDVDPVARAADRDSEEILLAYPQPVAFHAAGGMAFALDGRLLVPLGDATQGAAAQDMASLLGSVIRLDVRGGGEALDCAEAGSATVPADNPHADGPGGVCDELFAKGFRNPWRVSVDLATGTTWVGDVGALHWEEVDVLVAGGNYGWPVMEGAHCYVGVPGCDATGLTMPTWEYPRAPGQAVIGGHVYRGAAIPQLEGRYVFGDHSTTGVWALRDTGAGVTADPIGQLPGGGVLTSFGVDGGGELYAATLFGPLLRMVPAPLAGPAGPGTARSDLRLAGPSPFERHTAVWISAGETGPVRLTLVDALGRTVATLLDGPAAAGDARVVSIDGDTLAPGIYTVVLRARGGDLRSLRIVLTR